MSGDNVYHYGGSTSCKKCRTCKVRACRRRMSLAEYYERWPSQRTDEGFRKEPPFKKPN